MAEGRIKRKVVWEKSGVSEIIGTILMLSITVVLFSSIITFVGNMPAPRQTFVVELKCSLANWNGNDSVDLRILHQGGRVMDDLFTYIYVSVDSVTLSLKIDDGLRDTNGDNDWGVGEYWVYTIGSADVAPETLSRDSSFSVTIVDIEKNTLIWQETLGEGINVYAPIIKRLWIDSDLATPEVDDPGPIGFSDEFKVYAEIVDPEGIYDPLTHENPNGLNKSNIWVNLSSMFGPLYPPIQLNDTVDSRDAENDNIYVAVCTGPEGTGPRKVPVGYYWLLFNATDNSGLPAERAEKFPVGLIVGEKPQIVVKGDNPDTGKWEYITFSNPEPTNGDTVTITSTILNLGGAGAYVDVWFYQDSLATVINTDRNADGSPDPVTILVPQLGQQDAKISWKASPGGVHTILVTADVNASYHDITEFYDPDPTDNMNSTHISVMPKILLVDDDGHANDLSDLDTVSFMRASLEAADFDYDFTVVGAGDGPGYDYGDYRLRNYDVVIWMTGYQTTNTLTSTPVTGDITNLQKFLHPADTTNGGSLWLVSQGFWLEAFMNPSLGTFARDYLHLPDWTPTTDPLPELYGNMTHPVTDYFANNPITFKVGGASVHGWDYLSTAGLLTPGMQIALTDSNSTSDMIYAMSYNSTANPTDPVDDSRILSQTWGFSRIADTATQAQYAYKAILWLGNITAKYSADVAISEQTVEPATVFYKQQVTIRFTVRNNGLTNYTTADNLYFLLRVTDMDGLDVKNGDTMSPLPSLQRIDFLGTKSNNTLEVSFDWVPQEIGYHRISVKIDPYNYIEESNELNNEISSYWGTGALDVQYRVLVVDDDGSANNGGLAANETSVVTGALDFLGYEYETYTANFSMDGPAFTDGGNRSALNEYNAVIWVTGSTTDPLTVNDRTNITDYMGIGGNFWLLGDGLEDDDPLTAPFLQDYLKIASINENQGLPASIVGVDDDAVAHGMDYPCGVEASADILVGGPSAIGFTYGNAGRTAYNSIRYDGEFLTNPNVEYRAATTAWLLSSLTDEESRAEFTFMILRWFDKPEDRIEVRIADVDVWISDAHPQLGSGYVIQASVQNTGGATGNVLVRFMDGTTQIGSDSISVSPNGWTTAEMIWIPLFAGQRTIRVLLDPPDVQEVPEIFEWSNNNATRSVYVYFFWDDMESGTGKWAHGSTIALINGEQPLEYFGSTVVTVNIEKDWDYALSQYVVNCTDIGFYHTYDKAFWLQEPAGSTSIATSRPPIDVVFALDTSGSMTATAMTNLRAATQNFIGKLTEEDRAAIFTYDGGWSQDDTGAYDAADAEPLMQRSYLYMNATNRASFNTTIAGFTSNGYTPFYDTVGEAIQYTQENLLPDRLEYVIAMTDGVSNSDDEWTPETTWGMTTTSDPQDYDDDNWRQNSGGLKGIINPPCMVYSIGLGITHDPSYPTAPDWSRDPPVADNVGTDNYEYEYDVWHIADSSPSPLHDAGGKYGENATTLEDNVGHYYYTTDSAQLPTIFEDIFSSIVIGTLEGEDQTRSSVPGPTVKATLWSDGFETNSFANWDAAPTDWAVRRTTTGTDYGGQVVTVHGGSYCADGSDQDGADNWLQKTVDLSGVTGASLTFWWDAQDIDDSTESAYLSVYDGTWHNNIWNTGVLDDGDFQTDAADWALATVDLSGYNMVSGFVIRFTTPAAMDTTEGTGGTAGTRDDEFMLDDVVLSGNVAPYIVSTTPANGALGILTTANIVITFSQAMLPTSLAWTISPNPGGWTETWSAGNTVVTLSHSTAFNQSTVHTVQVTAARNTGGVNMIASSTPNPWTFTTDGPPKIISTAPANGAIDVALASTVVVTFSKAMNTASVTFTCAPAVTVWSVVWSAGNTVATYSHTNNFAQTTLYTFTITAGTDTLGNALAAGAVPNPWTFTTIADKPPTITATTPANGAVMVALASTVVVTFSEAMSTASVTYSCVPAVTVWSVAWSAGNTVATYSHTNNFAANTQYTFAITAALDTTGNGLAPGVPNPWTFRTLDTIPPTITSVTPSDGSTGVGLSQPVLVQFSEAMNTGSVAGAISFSPNPGGWSFTWDTGSSQLTAQHYDFTQMTTYTIVITTAAKDASGLGMASSYTWSFTTGTSGGSGSTPGISPDGANCNKSAVTKSMDLRNLESANLEFWHKYNMVPGANGGVLMLGFYNETAAAWQYRYVVPSSAYTGNLRLNATDRVDSFGTFIQWGWNGISGRGTFSWEKVSLDLLYYLDDINPAWLDQVRIKFQYYQYGGGTGYGWYIDDVRITVSRAETNPDNTTADAWRMITEGWAYGGGMLHTAHSGDHAWWNGNTTTGQMMPGIDNYLMTMPIDLTNARVAYLSAYTKFNFNYNSGSPPDGFRIEVSKDNGISWVAVNLGVRSAWNVSGTDADAEDGYVGDGKSYTGICDAADAGSYWVNIGSLTRVNIDLASFSGNAILIRFRVVTCSDPAYAHSNNAYQADPGFGGFYLDDVQVMGETILG